MLFGILCTDGDCKAYVLWEFSVLIITVRHVPLRILCTDGDCKAYVLWEFFVLIVTVWLVLCRDLCTDGDCKALGFVWNFFTDALYNTLAL